MQRLFYVAALVLALGPLSAHAAVPDAPANLTVVGGIYTNDTTPTITWSAVSDAVHYDYKLNNNNYRGVGTETSITLDALSDGWYTASVRAQDATGNSSNAASITFEIDTAGPTIPALSPSSATVGTPVTLKTTPTGESTTVGCTLTVDDTSAGAMTGSNGTFGKSVTFSTTGKHKAYATCIDGDNNTTVGSPTTIDVASSSYAQQGDVIMASCTSGADTYNSCHTVYYYGDDGKRHAFPTESVYYSWYDDFSTVRVVSQSFLDSLQIGPNVTLRPGAALVRFVTDPDVYAIDDTRMLRHYVSETLVSFDYGSGWTSFLITLPDILRSNYSLGAKIDESTDYDPQTVWDAIRSIADLF